MLRCNFSRREYQIKKKEFDDYKKKVWKETRKQPITILENWKLRGRRTNDYHLDHIVSIKYGFVNGILPEVIGNIRNLRFIPRKENLRKSDYLEKESWEMLVYLMEEGFIYKVNF